MYLGAVVVHGVCLVNEQRRWESRSIVCGFVRSRSLAHGAVTDATVCPLPCPAAPHTHPFVNSAADSTAGVRPSAEGPAPIISRSTVPPARVVSIRLTSGAAAVGTTAVLIHGALQTDSHRGGTTPGRTPFRCNRLLPPAADAEIRSSWVKMIDEPFKSVPVRLTGAGPTRLQAGPRRAAAGVGFVSSQHVPDDRCQAAHHGHPRDL